METFEGTGAFDFSQPPGETWPESLKLPDIGFDPPSDSEEARTDHILQLLGKKRDALLKKERTERQKAWFLRQPDKETAIQLLMFRKNYDRDRAKEVVNGIEDLVIKDFIKELEKPPDNVEKRFMSKVMTESKLFTCHLWTGAKGTGGYGVFQVDGKLKRAHVYAWERVNGPVPPGFSIWHTCGMRSCVNIEHLACYTPSDGAKIFNRKPLMQTAVRPEAMETLAKRDSNYLEEDDIPLWSG